MSIRISAGLIYDLVTQQCAIPVFKNLLPEPHNGCILNLLFDLAAWHAYAKLRLHMSDTLAFFDTATLTLAVSQSEGLGWTNNHNQHNKGLQKGEWWCASAVPERFRYGEGDVSTPKG